ncbi:MAG TPA: pentapeptide repeat-containing protein [Streptosporangiaceae bacterium]|nr:pentapeptide repeat-containing protein [Streptosporangiaceae bacterium]
MYNCHGAGQKVAQVTFSGRDWRLHPQIAEQMFEAFRVMRQLHELVWYTTEALRLLPNGVLDQEVRATRDEIEQVTQGDADTIVTVDVAGYRRRVNALLLKVGSELIGAGVARKIERRNADLSGTDLTTIDLHGADLAGANLSRANLAGADLSGANLSRANLSGANVSDASMTGTCLDRANVSGADLRHSLHLTQTQLNGTVGDTLTKIPPSLTRPVHWG